MPEDASAIEREPYDRVLVLGEPHHGKAMPVTERVLTPDGWRQLGSLVVGDRVIGSSGSAISVLKVTPQGVRRIVRVTADDGATALCDVEHLWLTSTRYETYRAWRFPAHAPRLELKSIGVWSAKTAASVARTLDEGHFLPRLRAPVRFEAPQEPLPLPPYLLGLLLGDGSFSGDNSVRLTSADEELLVAFEDGARALGGDCIRYAAVGCQHAQNRGGRLRRTLREMGLLGLPSQEKFVPDEYLRASPEDRLALLRGLMDTDGHAHKQWYPSDDGVEHEHAGCSLQAEYSTTSARLRDAVVELVRSLGGRARVRFKPEPRCQTGAIGLPAWAVTASFEDGTCPFALSRKKAIWRGDMRRNRFRQRIVAIAQEGEAECVCISVDAADQLYVTNDYLLTHNSTSVVASAAEAFGMGYVINCGKRTGLLDAARRCDRFKWDLIRDEIQMEAALKEARRGCKEGRYKWFAIDDYNLYGSWLEQVLEDQTRNKSGEPDGRRYWREYRKRLMNVIIRCFDIPAHFYCICHYIETGGGLIDGQVEKTGLNVVPMFGGAARKEIPAYFADTVFLTPHPKDHTRRVFHINPVGVFGPSCLSAPGTSMIDADVGLLHKEFLKGGKAVRTASTANRAVNRK